MCIRDSRYSNHDMYISADQSVIISLWNYSTPPSTIYITKSGYATNKGVMVGMTRSEVESLYGPLLEDTESVSYTHLPCAVALAPM